MIHVTVFASFVNALLKIEREIERSKQDGKVSAFSYSAFVRYKIKFMGSLYKLFITNTIMRV